MFFFEQRVHTATVFITVIQGCESIIFWGNSSLTSPLQDGDELAMGHLWSWEHSHVHLWVQLKQGTMTAKRNPILVADYVHSFLAIMFPNANGIFQQDNAPHIKARSVMEWFEQYSGKLHLINAVHQYGQQRQCSVAFCECAHVIAAFVIGITVK